MPRRPRTELAGGIHHVWQRGNNRQPIFLNTGDRRIFLRLLELSARKHKLQCLAYCLMDNHFHLVLETPVCSLGDAMRDCLSRYAQLFNERHTCGGHLFQARFKSKLVETNEQFGQLLRYVAHNPVSAGLCAEPAHWPWSSHVALLEGCAHTFVAAERVAALLDGVSHNPGLTYRRLFESDGPLQHIPLDLSPWKLRPTLGQILNADDLAAAVRRARRHGYRVKDVAEYLGVNESTLRRRCAKGATSPFSGG